MQSAAVGSVPCVRALLAYGADAAATDSTGATARQLAALAGHRAAELYLLAVESTAAASPGHPTRAELLAGQDQRLDAIFRLACAAKDEVRGMGGGLFEPSHAGAGLSGRAAAALCGLASAAWRLEQVCGR